MKIVFFFFLSQANGIKIGQQPPTSTSLSGSGNQGGQGSSGCC